VSDLDRAALAAERDFLLRSLDDLEDEREAGNVDDGTYQQLHDDYTARAAAAIRSLEVGTDVTPPDPPSASRLVRAITVGSILVFAVAVAFVLTRSVGQRRAGQTITGNNQVSSSSTTGADPGPALAAQARANPKNYSARISYARYLIQARDFENAIEEFGATAKLDPSQPEPPTYAGWAGALLAQQVKAPETSKTLLDASLERINEVIKDHPEYPDAYAFRGVILFNFQDDAKQAIPAFQKFLTLTDDSNPIRPIVLEALAAAVKASESDPK
jgi:tetratricopeptide (TPR) repeat protein